MGSNSGGGVSMNFSTLADNIGAGGIFINDKDGDNNESITVRNSILDGDGSGTGIRLSHSPSTNLDYNDIYNFSTAYDGASAGENSLVLDPEFVDASKGDYTLLSSSGVIDMADPTATLTVDLLGDERPQGEGYDMGAYEVEPIPEPSVLAFLLLGALPFVIRRR